MIRIVLSYNRELMNFVVSDKNIYYKDKKWGKWVRCLPIPVELKKQAKKVGATFIDNLFTFNEAEMHEYDNSNTEEEIADIIERDSQNKGCNLILRKNVEGAKPLGEFWNGNV